MIKSYWYCFISLKWKLYSLRPKIYQALQHHVICIDYIYRDTENGATQFFWLKLITGNWESFLELILPKSLFIQATHRKNPWLKFLFLGGGEGFKQKIAQYWGLKPTTGVWVTWIRPMSIYVWTMLWHFLLSTACFDKLTCRDNLTLMHNAITY